MSNQNNIGDSTKEVDYDKNINHDHVRQRLVVNRIRMMTKEPFYGTIAINLRLKELEKDHKVKDMVVDGHNLWYNPWFIDALTDDEIVFAMAHLVLHLVLRHLTRRGKRDLGIYGDASDYVINAMLVRDNIGTFPTVGGLYDEKYLGKTTEEVYEELKEKGGGEGGSGGNFDSPIEIKMDGDGNDQDGESVSLSADQIAQLDNDIKSAIMQAAEAAKNANAGKVPGEIERLITELTEPRMNWRDLLRENAKSQVKFDYSWKKQNRRFASSGFIIPGTSVEDHYEFVVGIDASGSMSQEQLQDFLSEIYFIADCFQSFKVGIFTFDTKVYNYQEFDQDTIDDLLEYVPKGGGGTCFDCCFEYMKEHLPTPPQTFVMLTDGFPFNSWGDEEYCETIFLIHDDYAIGQKVTAPFGTTLYYDDYTK